VWAVSFSLAGCGPFNTRSVRTFGLLPAPATSTPVHFQKKKSTHRRLGFSSTPPLHLGFLAAVSPPPKALPGACSYEIATREDAFIGGEIERGGGAGGDMVDSLGSIPTFCFGIWLGVNRMVGSEGERSAAAASPEVCRRASAKAGGTGEAILCRAKAPAGCCAGRCGVGETTTAPTPRRWPTTPEGGHDRGQHARARDAEEEGGQEEVPPALRAGSCRHCWCALWRHRSGQRRNLQFSSSPVTPPVNCAIAD
jgi:hypothetical protein